MSSRIILLLLFFIIGATAANAQSRGSSASGDPFSDEAQIVEEMRVRWEIKYAEKTRLENLERAREAAQLGSELHNAYARAQVFSQAEKKKLDRLEKVTRKIRSMAGGTDGDVTIENMPSQIEPALKRLAELSDELRKAVEKTPRHVVSASVIERANEVLEVIRYLRSWTR